MMLPPTDPSFVRRRRRQFFWQILAPVLLTTFLFMGLTVLLIVSGPAPTRLWADIALIWLLLPALLLALVLIVALGFGVFGLARLSRWLSRYSGQAIRYVSQGSAIIHRLANVSVRPVLWMREAGAVGDWLLHSLLPGAGQQEKESTSSRHSNARLYP